MPLPNFIVIGPGKTGTSWLYECLLAHPQVCMAKDIKETLFFLDNYGKGTAWYERFFEHCGEQTVSGEVSNTYFFSPSVPARAAEVVPNAKLVASLRNPMDRLFSLYLFRLRNGLVSGCFEDVIEAHPDMVEQNFFHTHLQRWLDHFDRAQLHVALYDDLKADPRGYVDGVFRFLGVRTGVELDVIDQRVLPASRPRSSTVFHLAKRAGLLARKLEFYRLLTWAKRSPLVGRLLLEPYNDADRPRMKPETRERLRTVFRQEVELTGELLGRDLSMWV